MAVLGDWPDSAEGECQEDAGERPGEGSSLTPLEVAMWAMFMFSGCCWPFTACWLFMGCGGFGMAEDGMEAWDGIVWPGPAIDVCGIGWLEMTWLYAG